MYSNTMLFILKSPSLLTVHRRKCRRLLSDRLHFIAFNMWEEMTVFILIHSFAIIEKGTGTLNSPYQPIEFMLALLILAHTLVVLQNTVNAKFRQGRLNKSLPMSCSALHPFFFVCFFLDTNRSYHEWSKLVCTMLSPFSNESVGCLFTEASTTPPSQPLLSFSVPWHLSYYVGLA